MRERETSISAILTVTAWAPVAAEPARTDPFHSFSKAAFSVLQSRGASAI
jgi:hypothetical protein